MKKATQSTVVNDQQKELYLLKTGTVLSVNSEQLKGVYNDDSEWAFKCPPEISIYPNAKVQLFRYHLEDRPDVKYMLVVMDPQFTYQFVIGSSGNGEELLQYGVSRTLEDNYFSARR